MKFAALSLLFGLCASAQAQPGTTNAVPNAGPANSHPIIITSERQEAIRSACIAGRRCICGKIIQVLPDGLVVDSGYADLMRAPLNKSWLVSGTVTASRALNLVEGKDAGCVAVGPVFLTNLPKSRGSQPKVHEYDYVVVTGYPAGHFTYQTIGSVTHTVRRFTSTLPRAVDLNMAAETRLNADNEEK